MSNLKKKKSSLKTNYKTATQLIKIVLALRLKLERAH